jgi:hypothetical protein
MSIPGFVCFDSLSEDHLSPVGAVVAGQEVCFKLRLPKQSGAHAPRLLVYEADRFDRPVIVLPMLLMRDEAAQIWYPVVGLFVAGPVVLSLRRRRRNRHEALYDEKSL